MRTYSIRAVGMLIVSLLYVLAPNRTSAGLNVLDFEGGNLPSGVTAQASYDAGSPILSTSQLAGQYLSTYGVKFSSGSAYVAVLELGAGHATSGVNGIGGSTPDGLVTYSPDFPIVATFWDPTNPSVPAVTDFVSVRGDLIPNGPPITLEALDLNGALLASDTEFDNFGGTLLSCSVAGIHSVRFLGNGTTAIDDFTFNSVNAVPLPGAVLLGILGMGAGGLGLRRYR